MASSKGTFEAFSSNIENAISALKTSENAGQVGLAASAILEACPSLLASPHLPAAVLHQITSLLALGPLPSRSAVCLASLLDLLAFLPAATFPSVEILQLLPRLSSATDLSKAWAASYSSVLWRLLFEAHPSALHPQSPLHPAVEALLLNTKQLFAKGGSLSLPLRPFYLLFQFFAALPREHEWRAKLLAVAEDTLGKLLVSMRPTVTEAAVFVIAKLFADGQATDKLRESTLDTFGWIERHEFSSQCVSLIELLGQNHVAIPNSIHVYQSFPNKAILSHLPGLPVNFFWHACCAGDLDLVSEFYNCLSLEDQKRLLETGDGRHDDNRSVLHKVAQRNVLSVAKFLIAEFGKHKLRVDIRDITETTPLHLACIIGAEEVARLLVANGAEVAALRRRKHSALQIASQYGHAGVMELLLDSGADIDADNGGGHTRGSPLHRAAGDGALGVCKVLIARGANLNAKNKFEETPLHVAAREANAPLVELLIKSGALLDEVDNNGWTALMTGAYYHSAKVVELLIRAGCQLTATARGYTALHFASDLDMAKVLVEVGKLDLNAVSLEGLRPMNYFLQYPPLLHYMIEQGVDLNYEPSNLIRDCIYRGMRETLDILAKGGADVNFASTPPTLHVAITRNETAMDWIKQLISHGAQPLLQPVKGNTFEFALSAARSRSDITDIMKALVGASKALIVGEVEMKASLLINTFAELSAVERISLGNLTGSLTESDVMALLANCPNLESLSLPQTTLDDFDDKLSAGTATALHCRVYSAQYSLNEATLASPCLSLTRLVERNRLRRTDRAELVTSILRHWKSSNSSDSISIVVSRTELHAQKQLVAARLPSLMEGSVQTKLNHLFARNKHEVALPVAKALIRYIHYNELPGDWELEIDPATTVSPPAEAPNATTTLLIDLLMVLRSIDENLEILPARILSPTLQLHQFFPHKSAFDFADYASALQAGVKADLSKAHGEYDPSLRYACIGDDLGRILASHSHADFTIVLPLSPPVTFQCHQALLCARWPYFQLLISASMREAQSGHLELQSPHSECVITAELMRKLLVYFYTGQVAQFTVAAENYALLQLFEYFGFSEHPEVHQGLALHLASLADSEDLSTAPS